MTEETVIKPSTNQPAPPPALKPHRSVAPRTKRVLFVLIVSLLCFGFGFAGATLANQMSENAATSQFISPDQDGNQVQTSEEKTIAAVVDRVSPSVVSIVSSVANGRFAAQGAGTGMIVSANGYVMTNKHVVEGARNITVVTSSGKTYENVELVGQDPLNDIAFLRIPNVSGLPSVTIGDSKTIRSGQSVVAIGNALGQFQNTVTSGIISGLGRPILASSEGIDGAESLTDLIQTDAAINSGNSGGPLLNMQGQVIGINTAVAQDANSIGFAIPVGAAKGMLTHLLETGKVERAVVGLQYISITPDVRSEFNLDVDRGDYVNAESGSAVRPGSPAAQADIRNGDIVTKVNDVTIEAGKSISTLIGEFKPGDKVELTIIRDGKTLQKQVTLIAYSA